MNKNSIAFVNFGPRGQKLLKSWNLILKKIKFNDFNFLFSHSTTIRKNDWMVITFEETPTNVWELFFFFVGCFFLPIHIPVF